MLLKFTADNYKTQKVSEKAVEVKGWTLRLVPDQYKMQKMCNKDIEKIPMVFLSNKPTQKSFSSNGFSVYQMPLAAAANPRSLISRILRCL